jgi:hypothetical protein
MNLKYKCQKCEVEFETKHVFNGFCPSCGYDYLTCLNFDEWDRATGLGKRRAAELDLQRKKRLDK